MTPEQREALEHRREVLKLRCLQYHHMLERRERDMGPLLKRVIEAKMLLSDAHEELNAVTKLLMEPKEVA